MLSLITFKRPCKRKIKQHGLGVVLSLITFKLKTSLGMYEYSLGVVLSLITFKLIVAFRFRNQFGSSAIFNYF